MKTFLTDLEKHTLRRIASGMPLEETLTGLLCTLQEAVPGLRAAVLYVDQDPDGVAPPRLRFGSAPDMGDAYRASVDGTRLIRGNSPSADAVLSGESIFIEHGQKDPRCSAAVRAVYNQFGICACYIVPLIDAKAGAVTGVLCFYPTHTGPPTKEESTLLAAGTDLCTLALTRANAEGARRRSEAAVGHLLSGLRRQAMTDPLTGLANRTSLLQSLAQALPSAPEISSKPDSKEAKENRPAVLFIDLDRFKTINDTLGHHAGDRLLIEMATRFSRTVQKGVVARLGGDEFVILLPDADATSAMDMAKKIRDLSTQPVLIDGQPAFVDSSIGVALWREEAGLTAEVLLNNADTAMYHAKQDGGNGCALFTTAMGDAALRRVTLESDLHHALENGEMHLVFQPQFDSVTGRMIGVEALLRWHHPKRGMVPPDDFIPIAEESGIIDLLGEWVLREACRYGAQWQRFVRPLRVAVNLSARQFALRNRLAEQVEHVLAQTGFDPCLLDLEITESVLLTKNAPVSETLDAIKRIGVRLLLDDFGTGYGSLLYLRNFPLDVIKVDRSFVGGVTKTKEDRAIVGAVIDLAHALGLRVIAEGVETNEQRAELALLGCDALQGYLLSRPLPPESIVRLLIEADEEPKFPSLIGD